MNVSVIIPVFNQTDVLIQTLKSIQSQSLKTWECLLIDDGSGPKTKKIILDFTNLDERFKLYDRPVSRSKGANSCRNYGLELAKYPFIQWFDADDIMHPYMLEKKITMLNSDCNLDFVLSEGVDFVEDIKNITGVWKNLESKYPLIDHAFGVINIPTPAPLFRKEFLKRSNGFNEGLQRKQEYEFFSRLLGLSPNYKVVREALFFYRKHAESINGRNSKHTVYSRLKADFLVFQNLDKLRFMHSIEHEKVIRRHFFNKIANRVKLALESKDFKSVFFGLYVLWYVGPLEKRIFESLKRRYQIKGNA